jgi:hypothetical protein
MTRPTFLSDLAKMAFEKSHFESDLKKSSLIGTFFGKRLRLGFAQIKKVKLCHWVGLSCVGPNRPNTPH